MSSHCAVTCSSYYLSQCLSSYVTRGKNTVNIGLCVLTCYDISVIIDIDLTLESVLLAIGGNDLVNDSDHYASIVGEYFGIETNILNDADIRISDLLAILDPSYEGDEYSNEVLENVDKEAYVNAIKEADIISLDLGADEIVSFVVNQVLAYIYDNYGDEVNRYVAEQADFSFILAEHKAYDMNWASLSEIVGEEQLDEALAIIEKVLAFADVPTEIELADYFKVDAFDLVSYAGECCLYAVINYMYGYSRAIDAIHSINEDAEVMILSSLNALDGLMFSIAGNDIDLGVIADALVLAMDACAISYAYNTPNTYYVYVGEAETISTIDGIVNIFDFINVEGIEEGTLVSFTDISFGATAFGHEYIAEQILKAINSEIPCHHFYDGCEDADCNECGFVREAGKHDFSNCTDKTCSNCSYVREAGAHVYDGCFDAECNLCHAERIPGHTYSEVCSEECEICGFVRTSEHSFGEWITTKEATRKESGEKERTCSVCGKTETAIIDAIGGLSAGAVVGIAGGAVVTAGCGTFSIVWFVIKKKTFADLVGVFKNFAK